MWNPLKKKPKVWTEELIVLDLAKQDGSEKILECPRNELIAYHHTLGRHIRNTYKLWEKEHTPVIIDGVDCAEDHPDAISMRIIEKLYDYKLNESKK